MTQRNTLCEHILGKSNTRLSNNTRMHMHAHTCTPDRLNYGNSFFSLKNVTDKSFDSASLCSSRA
jgi:hypothetical protein